ncbi:MAG: T9SS type A sorting domain-containing protein [Paludibacteraceae bacterium]|nr:T9SS type A sorting domain-containing protein [Paludibacteraceae bacterium]
MTKLGVRDSIRCLDYQLSYIQSSPQDTGLFSWEGKLSSDNHPRQTLITEQGVDTLCKELSMISPNGEPSILLASDEYEGNAIDSAKGEAVAFYYTVDKDYPIIQLNYAAVLEKGHDLAAKKGFETYAQPHMRIYLVGSDNNMLCLYQEYMYSNCKDVEGWTSFKDTEGNDAIWHDWTTIGIDVSQYVDRRITLVVEAYDCAEESQSGTQITLCRKHEKTRVYCNMTCAPAYEIEQTCTPSQTTLIAPKGFTYKWQPVGYPDSIMSTKDTVRFTTPLEKTSYVCQLQSLVGCDPVPHTIDIDATRVYGSKTDTVCIADIDDFKWDDGEPVDRKVLTHEFMITTEGGCDSVVTQKIILQDTTVAPLKLDTLPETGGYQWRGKTYTEVGTYRDTAYYPSGCDQTYYTLQLVAAGISGNFKFAPACANDKQAVATFTYTTSQPKKYNVVFDADAKAVGFKDTTILANNGSAGVDQIAIAIPQNSDSTRYARPNTYNLTINVTDSTNEVKAIKTTLSILYPAWLIYQRWKDMLIIYNDQYNGGYKFSDVRWFMGENSTELVARGEHHSYIYAPDNGNDALDLTADYWAELTREDDGKAICTCKIKPQPNTDADAPVFVAGAQVSVSPAVMSGGNRTMHIVTDLEGTYTICDISGTAIQNGSFKADTDVVIRNAATGAYIVTFRGNEGTVETKKIIVTL